MKREEYLKRVRKVDDEEFLELYNRGLSDGEIAKCFSCSSSVIQARRKRMGLIANFENPNGNTLTKEELLERWKEIIKKNKNRNMKKYSNNEVWKKRYIKNAKINNKRSDRKEKIKEYQKKYQQSEKYKEYKKKIYTSEYWKEINNSRKDKLKEYNKTNYKRLTYKKNCLDCGKKITKKSSGRCGSCSSILREKIKRGGKR